MRVIDFFRLIGYLFLLLVSVGVLLGFLPVVLILSVVFWVPFGIGSAFSSRKVSSRESSPRTAAKRVAVVGAGVAGLQTARSLREANIEVKVFDKASAPGGVWRENYADYSLQVPGALYEFPGYTYKDAGLNFWWGFPDGPTVQKYILSYVKYAGLSEVLALNTQVETTERRADKSNGWTVTSKNVVTGEQIVEDFDFVVVATGMYSTPFIPQYKGLDSFAGKTYHSSQFTDAKLAEGKRTLVVGAGKSAADVAVAANNVSENVTLLSRKAHWPVPRYLLFLVPFKFGTYSRFGHAFLPLHHDPSWFQKILHVIGAPVVWLFWRVVEVLIICQFRLTSKLVPSEKLEKDLFTGGVLLKYDLTNRINSGKIALEISEIENFTSTGVVLKGGKAIDVDVVVFATGFTKEYGYLPVGEKDKLGLQDDGLYLYNQILPPRIPGLAYIGAEVSTFNNILTHGLQAEWLAGVLTGKIHLPTIEAQEAHVKKVQEWKRAWMPKISSRGAIVQLHMLKYHDDLVRELGQSPYRKLAENFGGKLNPWNYVTEFLSPYEANDYKKLFPAPAKKVDVVVQA
jgi:dimethylaniline monooxygenase (N-oxide forming)